MRDLSFMDNVSAAVPRLGLQNSILIYSLAKATYDSVEERDRLFDELGGKTNGG